MTSVRAMTEFVGSALGNSFCIGGGIPMPKRVADDLLVVRLEDGTEWRIRVEPLGPVGTGEFEYVVKSFRYNPDD